MNPARVLSIVKELDAFLSEMREFETQTKNLEILDRKLFDREKKLEEREFNVKKLETELKEQKDYVDKKNVEIEKAGNVLEQSKLKFTELKVQEERNAIERAKLEEKGKKLKVEYEDKLKEYNSLAQDLNHQMAFIEKEKQVDVMRKEALDIREKRIKDREAQLQRMVV